MIAEKTKEELQIELIKIIIQLTLKKKLLILLSI